MQDLASEKGNLWRQSIAGFLGVSTSDYFMEKIEKHSWNNNTHVKCSERVKNWDEVEKNFNNTIDIKLCEKEAL